MALESLSSSSFVLTVNILYFSFILLMVCFALLPSFVSHLSSIRRCASNTTPAVLLDLVSLSSADSSPNDEETLPF